MNRPTIIPHGQPIWVEQVSRTGLVQYIPVENTLNTILHYGKLVDEVARLRDENERMRKLMQRASVFIPFKRHDCKAPKSGKGSRSGCGRITCPTCTTDAEKYYQESLDIKIALHDA